jgi:hypothetical protein
MTDVIVQLNFNTGAGDLYCAITQLINFSKKCFESGYSVGFYYNFQNNQYFFDTNYINFDSFFEIEKKYYKFIEKRDVFDKFDGYFYAYTPYLYSRQQGGLHWWDVFIKNENIKVKDAILNNAVTCCMREWRTEEHISIFPRFSKSILDLTLKNTNKMVGLHIRNMDQSETMNLVNDNIQKIEKLIDSNTVYLCSNSRDIRKFFETKNKIVMMFPRNEQVSYHYGAFKNNAKENNKILIENFEDTLAEMHNLSLCDKIYTLTEWGRPTNFLFYSKAFNKNVQIESL